MVTRFLTPADDQAFKNWMHDHRHEGFYLSQLPTAEAGGLAPNPAGLAQ
jgi:hypothetical protein